VGLPKTGVSFYREPKRDFSIGDTTLQQVSKFIPASQRNVGDEKIPVILLEMDQKSRRNGSKMIQNDR